MNPTAFLEDSSMNNVVKTIGVSKTYKMGKTDVFALKNVDLEILRGSFIAIAGPSGSGKTTLLNLIGCLDRPSMGEIEISNQTVSSMTNDELADIRCNKIGFIFQTFNLIPVLSAFENVEFPLLLGKYSANERKERTLQALEDVKILDHAKHRPDELSGGQRQRVAIARALVKSPEIVLADEPTANLDSETGESIVKLMLELNHQKGTTFLFATHDPMVMQHAGTTIRLHDGQRKHIHSTPN